MTSANRYCKDQQLLSQGDQAHYRVVILILFHQNKYNILSDTITVPDKVCVWYNTMDMIPVKSN